MHDQATRTRLEGDYTLAQRTAATHLRGVDQRIAAHAVARDEQVGLDVPDGLLQGKTVPSHDVGGVDLVADQLVSALEKNQAGSSSSSRSARVSRSCLGAHRANAAARTCNSSAAKMTTDVVPSPTSLSCKSLVSTSTRAAGCATSSCFRMVAPSFVTVMSPMSSTCSHQRHVHTQYSEYIS